MTQMLEIKISALQKHCRRLDKENEVNQCKSGMVNSQQIQRQKMLFSQDTKVVIKQTRLKTLQNISSLVSNSHFKMFVIGLAIKIIIITIIVIILIIVIINNKISNNNNNNTLTWDNVSAHFHHNPTV